MLKILLIDDEPELLEITYEQLLLNFENINISRANSGNECINLLMKGHKFDLIISEYKMLNGNAVDLLKYKTSFAYPGYFLLYTSHIHPEIPQNLITHEFLGIVEKLKFDDLFSKITNLLTP